jgi:hypothetical protein
LSTESVDLARLIQRWSGGDATAFAELIPVVHDHLRQLAHQRLRREFGERTLDTTALVHEAYLGAGGFAESDAAGSGPLSRAGIAGDA